MAESARKLEVFTVIDKEGSQRSFWVKVGACFPNRDGSLNVYLDALPVNGRLHIRERSPLPENELNNRRTKEERS